jgi:hypothetical protein
LRGGSAEATVAGIVQLFVSALLAGFTGPFAVRSARLNIVRAYVYGSFVMASGVAFFGGLLHWYFESPNLSGTILWNFFLNLLGGGLVVFVIRNKNALKERIQKFLKRP